MSMSPTSTAPVPARKPTTRQGSAADRSGSYGARWVAKHLVAAGLCHRCVVEVAYVIGHPDPIAIAVDSYGTGLLPDQQLTEVVRSEFDLSPAAIIEELDLRRPIYAQTAVYGHFGRIGPDFTWEALPHCDRLREVGAQAKRTQRKHPATSRGTPRRSQKGK